MSKRYDEYPQVRLMPESVEKLEELGQLIPGGQSRTQLATVCIEAGADVLIRAWRKVRKAKGK